MCVLRYDATTVTPQLVQLTRKFSVYVLCVHKFLKISGTLIDYETPVFNCLLIIQAFFNIIYISQNSMVHLIYL